MKSFSINFTPPLSAILSSLIKDKDFQQDAKRLISLEQTKFDQLVALLNRKKEFVTAFEIEKHCETVLGCDSDAGSSISHLVARLDQVINDHSSNRKVGLQELEKYLVKIEGLLENEREELSHRIKALVGAQGITLQRKAETLAKQGVAVEGVDVICDIRPVFDLPQTEIAGLIPIVTLFLEIEGNSKPQMVMLSESMLGQLKEKIDKAHLKLQSLKKLSGRLELPVPKTSATEATDHGM